MNTTLPIEKLLSKYARAVETAYNHPIAWNRFDVTELRDMILEIFADLKSRAMPEGAVCISQKEYASLKSRAAVGDAVEAMQVGSDLSRDVACNGTINFWYVEYEDATPNVGATAREALGLKAKEQTK